MSEASKLKESWDDSSGDETSHSSNTTTTTSPAHTNNIAAKNEVNQSANANKDDTSADTIDSIVPSTQTDFNRFEKLLINKISSFDKSPLYIDFLASLMKDICNNLEVDDVRKISSSLEALSVEKSKLNKAKLKPKKKNKKAALVAGKSQKLVEDFGGDDDDAYDFDEM